VNKLAWQVFLAPAQHGLLLGSETGSRADETVNDAFVGDLRWLLPDSEYGLQIGRVYAAPRPNAMALRDHFMRAMSGKLPRRGERLLLIVEGFDLLEADDRIAHLETLRLGLRIPNVVIFVASARLDPRERKFFDLTLADLAGVALERFPTVGSERLTPLRVEARLA
jgi:hypothetical protein